MKQKPLIISLVFGTLVILGVIYLLNGNEVSAPENNETQQSVSTTDDTTTDGTESKTVAPGAYVDYSSSVIAETKGTKILFFHAPWCPQCQKLNSDIEKRGVPDDVTIIKVDYDSNQSLRKKYGVTIQTTTVLVDDNGELIKKFVAYDDPSLSAVLSNLP